jgi:hypothetical protein
MLTEGEIADRLAEVLRTPYVERFIGAQIAEALDTADRLEPPRKLGASNVFRNLIVAKTDDDIDAIERMLSRRRATPDEEAQFDEVIRWITPLPVRLRKLLWLRADGHQWRHIGRVMGVTPRWCQKLWRQAAAQIAEQDQKGRGA